MCEKNQLSFNYNKYDWILKKKAEISSHEYKGDNNKNDNNSKDKNDKGNDESSNKKD